MQRIQNSYPASMATAKPLKNNYTAPYKSQSNMSMQNHAKNTK